MAASTLSKEPSFGHYLLPLTMNKSHIDKQAEYHIEVKTRYLDLKKHRPERHALRNLLGMLHFRLDKYDESLAFFDKILSDGEDPENLNALANRKYICDNLYMIPESRDCKEKLTELLPDDYQDEGEESRLRRARSLAEQAFAYSFDISDESVTTERYRTSVELYDKAFKLAGKSLTQDEREDWMISKGMACHKIFDTVKWDMSRREESQIWLDKMVNIFIKIVDETDDKSLASESWRQLGEIFQRADLKSGYTIQVPDPYKKYRAKPLDCFEKALHHTPNDPRILARFAEFLRRIGHKKEAREKVDQSIRMDATVFNSLAFSVRGKILLQDYKKQLTACMKSNSSNQLDDSLLKQAQDDFEKHLAPMNLEKLAQVFYYMATDRQKNVKEGYDGHKYLQKALTMCARTAACMDGEKRSAVHYIRGKSLCALGEHQQAMRSFKRAVECEVSTNFLMNSGECLSLEYARVLKAMTGAQPLSFQTLFADMVYWLHKAAKTYLLNPHWSGSLDARTHLASNWADFVEYCEKNNYMRELKDIEEASLLPDQRPSKQSRRDETSHLPLPYVCPTRSAIEEAAKAPVYKPPHIKRRMQNVIEEASGTTVVSPDDYHRQVQVESTSTSLSALELGGDETSEEKRITLTVNPKTGKNQLIDQTSLSQEWTSDDASNKPIRSAPQKALNRDLAYDFFVIYSISASDWVFRCLLEELEGRGLKGCIKDRDFMIGQTKLNNYSGSTANSACVVIVITEDFEEDCWCDRGMLMAFEEGKLLIPLLREGTKLPKFLNTLTHLDATGAVDWTRVQKCIEQQIKLDAAT